MALTTWAGVAAASRQRQLFLKTGTVTTVANNWYTLITPAGNPGAALLTLAGAGSVAGGNPGVGQVPDDTGTLAGFLANVAFGGSNTGYLARVEWAANVASRIMIYDRLYQCGTYAANATQAMSGQPSFASRVPGGNDYTGCELWFETTATAFTTGAPVVTVAYNNQAGSGSTTGAYTLPLIPPAYRMVQLPLAAGDSGVSAVTNITMTGGTAGTWNIVVLRPLFFFRVSPPVLQGFAGSDQTGLIQIFQHTAFAAMCAADSTTSPVFEAYMEIVNG